MQKSEQKSSLPTANYKIHPKSYRTQPAFFSQNNDSFIKIDKSPTPRRCMFHLFFSPPRVNKSVLTVSRIDSIFRGFCGILIGFVTTTTTTRFMELCFANREIWYRKIWYSDERIFHKLMSCYDGKKGIRCTAAATARVTNFLSHQKKSAWDDWMENNGCTLILCHGLLF